MPCSLAQAQTKSFILKCGRGGPQHSSLNINSTNRLYFHFWHDGKILKLAAQLRVLFNLWAGVKIWCLVTGGCDFEVASFEGRTAEYRQGQNIHKKHQVLSDEHTFKPIRNDVSLLELKWSDHTGWAKSKLLTKLSVYICNICREIKIKQICTTVHRCYC